MKKIAIFFLAVIIIIVGISYLYLNYQFQYKTIKRDNIQFDTYYNKEIYGTELITIINRAIDKNSVNEIEKDQKGKYIDNGKDSIKIEIKMLDNDKTYSMERISAGGTDNFVKYYDGIKFKCTKVEYHKSTNRIKYMLFEQITQ